MTFGHVLYQLLIGDARRQEQRGLPMEIPPERVAAYWDSCPFAPTAAQRRVLDEIAKHPDVVLLLTADHGNADVMFDENGKVNTAHTTNPVPFLVREKGVSLHPGRLADIAPTILRTIGLDQPAEMTGRSLID